MNQLSGLNLSIKSGLQSNSSLFRCGVPREAQVEVFWQSASTSTTAEAAKDDERFVRYARPGAHPQQATVRGVWYSGLDHLSPFKIQSSPLWSWLQNYRRRRNQRPLLSDDNMSCQLFCSYEFPCRSTFQRPSSFLEPSLSTHLFIFPCVPTFH